MTLIFKNYLGDDFKNVGKSTFLIMSAQVKLSLMSKIVFGKELAYNEDIPEIGEKVQCL